MRQRSYRTILLVVLVVELIVIGTVVSLPIHLTFAQLEFPPGESPSWPGLPTDPPQTQPPPQQPPQPPSQQPSPSPQTNQQQSPSTPIPRGDILNDIRSQFATPGKLAKYETFRALLLKVLEIALSLIGAISALFIIIGGFKYVAARGNEEQQEAAKKTLTGAVIGLVFALLAFSIVRIISEIIISGRTGI